MRIWPSRSRPSRLRRSGQCSEKLRIWCRVAPLTVNCYWEQTIIATMPDLYPSFNLARIRPHIPLLLVISQFCKWLARLKSFPHPNHLVEGIKSSARTNPHSRYKAFNPDLNFHSHSLAGYYFLVGQGEQIMIGLL